VTGRYDEWAVARAPSLVRFAHALVDDAHAAEAAVRRALDRLHARWDRVVAHDDPDLVARAFVVDASGRGQATRRRAAVVLRTLEGRSDAEIADVLRCSESAARLHLARGSAGRVPGDTVDVTTTDPAAAAVRVLTRPEPVVVRSRPPGRRGASWLAALAVVALVGGIAVVDRITSTPAGVITYPTVRAPVDWRVESFSGVEVQVPATWGWGGAPFRSDIFGAARLGGCGSDHAAVRSPSDPASYASSRTPFVGRPAHLSYTCVPWGGDGLVPRTDAVWLGSPLAPGVRTLQGALAETRVVGGVHVTVFSDRSSLRRRILGTVRLVDVDDNGCPTEPVFQPSAPGRLTPTSLSVCVYSQESGTTELEWSGRVDAGAARAYAGAADAAVSGRSTCPTPSGQWVALGLHGDGAAVRWDLALPGCGAVETAAGQAPLTEATVRDWAVGGVTAYVDGPDDRALSDYFRASVGRTY